jgi:phage tail-like protein
MTMDVKTIREGGNNGKEIRLTGGFKFGQVTMKRGMTKTFDLWDWFNLMLTNQALRADAEVVLFANDGATERARFLLSRCVPVKLKSPALSAKDGAVAIEEFQLAYETLTLKKPQDGGE